MTTSDLVFAVVAAVLGSMSAVLAGVVLGALRVGLSQSRRSLFVMTLRTKGLGGVLRTYFLERRSTTDTTGKHQLLPTI